ncbi:MAG TPA: hypothetical protein VK470_19405 [Bacteroidota bacterium]|nr:hypothetical protein [Bacteroidota bacterium]
MTTDDASVLMNKFLDNEATDAEMRNLFLDLSESHEHRALFACMMTVNDTLLAPEALAYPPSIDRSLSALAMRDEDAPALSGQTMIASLPSSMLSGFVVCLLAVVLFFMASKFISASQVYDHQSVMNEFYQGGASSSHSFNQ